MKTVVLYYFSTLDRFQLQRAHLAKLSKRQAGVCCVRRTIKVNNKPLLLPHGTCSKTNNSSVIEPKLFKYPRWWVTKIIIRISFAVKSEVVNLETTFVWRSVPSPEAIGY